MPLAVCLDEELNPSTIGSEEPEVQAYSVTIEMQADLRLGINDVDEFQDFITLSSQIHGGVQEACFNSTRPYDKYVICIVKRGTGSVVNRVQVLQDEDLKVRVEKGEAMVQIISAEPSYLVRALKKYFPA
jgi:hypothetical protein